MIFDLGLRLIVAKYVHLLLVNNIRNLYKYIYIDICICIIYVCTVFFLNFFRINKACSQFALRIADFGGCCQKRQAEQNRGKVDIDVGSATQRDRRVDWALERGRTSFNTVYNVVSHWLLQLYKQQICGSQRRATPRDVY